MPTVQTYGQRKVALAAIPGVRQQAHLTAEALGAGTEIAQARASEEMGAFGATAARIGLAEYAQIKDAADQVAVDEATNKLGMFENQRLYDPQTGALVQQGKNAFDLPEQVRSDYFRAANAIESGLTTERQRLAFRRVRFQRGVNIDARVQAHVAGEIQTYVGQTMAATVTNAGNLAVANFDSDRRIAQELGRAEDAITTSGPRLGWGRERIDEELSKVRTATHVGVVNAWLARDQPNEAQSYYDANKDEVAGGARAEVEHRLETGRTSVTGLQTATEIWKQLGPTNDTDPIAIDQMEDAARAKFGSDTKAYDATVRYLRERKTGVDAARQDRKESTAGALWQAVNAGAPLKQIQSMPEYLRAPGSLQLQVSEHVVARNEAAAARSEAAASRAITQQTRAEHEKETKGWARFWEVSDPQRLAALSENQILGLTPELGTDHVNRLMQAKRSLLRSDESVRAATIDADLFNTIATSAGLPAYKTNASTDEKAQLGQLKNAVEGDIEAEQIHRKRALTRDEKAAIMHHRIDNKVMLDLWGTDRSLPAAAVINPKDQQRSYVPLEQIPQQSLSDWVNVIRSLSPSAQRLTPAEITLQWRDRIQRAHAAHVLQLGADEERKRLEGR